MQNIEQSGRVNTAFERLEPYDGKLSRTVLRGLGGGNTPWLPGLHENNDSAHKAKGWLKLVPTPNQLQYLPEHQGDYSMTRYKASALINLKFNARGINMAINNALESHAFPMKEAAHG